MCRMSITSSIRGRSAMVLSTMGREMIWEVASSVLVRSAVQSRTLEAQPAYCGSCGVSNKQAAASSNFSLEIHMSARSWNLPVCCRAHAVHTPLELTFTIQYTQPTYTVCTSHRVQCRCYTVWLSMYVESTVSPVIRVSKTDCGLTLSLNI